MSSSYNANYVPGTYIRIPPSYTAFKRDFKVIGKNVFVINPLYGKRVASSAPTVQELITKYGAATTLNEALRKEAKVRKVSGVQKEWILCTPSQRARYDAAKAKLDAFILKTQEEYRASRIKAATATLAKYGYGVYSKSAMAESAGATLAKYGFGGNPPGEVPVLADSAVDTDEARALAQLDAISGVNLNDRQRVCRAMGAMGDELSPNQLEILKKKSPTLYKVYHA